MVGDSMDEIDIHLGRRLRRRRRLLGLTQQELAHACGVRFQQIQKYECAANRMSAGALKVPGRGSGSKDWRMVIDIACKTDCPSPNSLLEILRTRGKSQETIDERRHQNEGPAQGRRGT